MRTTTAIDTRASNTSMSGTNTAAISPTWQERWIEGERDKGDLTHEKLLYIAHEQEKLGSRVQY